MVFTNATFTRLTYAQAIDDIPGVGTPSDAQLSLIQRQAPKGVIYHAENFVSVPILVSHNFMSHSNGVWHSDSLEAMARLFPGHPIALDHNWDEVESAVGFIYDAFTIRTIDAPINILNAADYFDVNRQILAKDGFIALILQAAFPVASAAAMAIGESRARYVSTGGLASRETTCPHCNTSFDDPLCPHDEPHPLTLYFYGDDPSFNFATHYIRGQFLAAIESSLVVMGNLPGAEILRG